MDKSSKRNLILTYIYLAASCFAVGVGILFIVLMLCRYFNIDIFKNIWVLAIPIILTLIINILVIELYHKITRR